MFRQRLIQPVEISGKNYFGLPSKIIIRPRNKPGWYWDVDGKEVPITPNMLQYRKRRVVIVSPDSKTCINVFEHIGVLRAFGIDGITIKTNSWPPYDGCARTLLSEIKPFLFTGSQKVEWKTVPHEFVGKYPNPNRYTKIQPNYQKQLDITVVINYQSLGKYKLRFVISDTDNGCVNEDILSIGSQGWPRNLYYISKIVSFFGWPHHSSIVWPQENETDETIKQFAKHRMLDVLGDFSPLFPKGGMLSATITSYCSGHEADVKAVNYFANKKLICL